MNKPRVQLDRNEILNSAQQLPPGSILEAHQRAVRSRCAALLFALGAAGPAITPPVAFASGNEKSVHMVSGNPNRLTPEVRAYALLLAMRTGEDTARAYGRWVLRHRDVANDSARAQTGNQNRELSPSELYELYDLSQRRVLSDARFDNDGNRLKDSIVIRRVRSNMSDPKPSKPLHEHIGVTAEGAMAVNAESVAQFDEDIKEHGGWDAARAHATKVVPGTVVLMPVSASGGKVHSTIECWRREKQ
jgi:hypothetical protein